MYRRTSRRDSSLFRQNPGDLHTGPFGFQLHQPRTHPPPKSRWLAHRILRLPATFTRRTNPPKPASAPLQSSIFNSVATSLHLGEPRCIFRVTVRTRKSGSLGSVNRKGEPCPIYRSCCHRGKTDGSLMGNFATAGFALPASMRNGIIECGSTHPA